MLWNHILLVYDGTENSLRSAEYIAKMFGQTEGVKVTIFGVHEKIPRHDFKDTSPVVDKLQKQISAMEIEIGRGQARIKESKNLLAKAGVQESAINIKFVERKQSALKDIKEEADKGGYGTIVIGRSDEKGLVLSGGSVARDLVAQCKDQAVIVL